MIKNYKQFLKLNENAEADPIIVDESPEVSADISPEDLVSQMSDKLGIDISNFDMDDICSNIELEGLTKNEARRAIFKHLMMINENKR